MGCELHRQSYKISFVFVVLPLRVFTRVSDETLHGRRRNIFSYALDVKIRRYKKNKEYEKITRRDQAYPSFLSSPHVVDFIHIKFKAFERCIMIKTNIKLGNFKNMYDF